MDFALRYFKKLNGKPAWFEEMTGIGPAFTSDPNKAARFASKDAALASPAARFAMAPVDVVEAPERMTT